VKNLLSSVIVSPTHITQKSFIESETQLLLEALPLISHSHAEHGNEIKEINERTMGN
jgi:hypothetical protein